MVCLVSLFSRLIGTLKIDYVSSSGLCSTSMVFSTLISTNWAHSEVSMTMCRKSKLSIECTAGSVSIILLDASSFSFSYAGTQNLKKRNFTLINVLRT